MEACNKQMVGRYVTAAMTARKYNVKDQAVQSAIARLAYLSDYLGDDKMRAYVEATPDPVNPGSKLDVHERRVLAVALRRRRGAAGERAARAAPGFPVIGWRR